MDSSSSRVTHRQSRCYRDDPPELWCDGLTYDHIVTSIGVIISFLIMVPIWYRDLKCDYLIPWSLHIHPQLHLLYSYSDYTALLSVFDCFTYMYFYTLSFFHPCTYIHMSNSFFSWAARNERGPASVALLQVSLFFLKGFSKFFLAWFEGLWTEGLTPVHILKRVKQQCWAFCFFLCMQRHNATLILVWLLTQSQILVRENKSIWCWSTKSFMKKEIEFVTAHIFFYLLFVLWNYRFLWEYWQQQHQPGCD